MTCMAAYTPTFSLWHDVPFKIILFPRKASCPVIFSSLSYSDSVLAYACGGLGLESKLPWVATWSPEGQKMPWSYVLAIYVLKKLSLGVSE